MYSRENWNVFVRKILRGASIHNIFTHFPLILIIFFLPNILHEGYKLNGDTFMLYLFILDGNVRNIYTHTLIVIIIVTSLYYISYSNCYNKLTFESPLMDNTAFIKPHSAPCWCSRTSLTVFCSWYFTKESEENMMQLSLYTK